MSMDTSATQSPSMLVVLKPTTGSDLMQIAIETNPFTIGRNHAPFSRYPEEIVSEMSKRHARLLATNGRLYVVDRDSRNGTLCNEESVGRTPNQIVNGDTLSFAGLAYEVIIVSLPDPTPVAAHKGVRLLLVPERKSAGLEPIMLTHFPFTIKKTSQVFHRQRQARRKSVAFLSKWHAHIFETRGRIYIEDLGSTNGTFVNSERLENGPRQLTDECLVTFGNQKVAYRTYVLSSSNKKATALPARLAEQIDAKKMIIMDAQALKLEQDETQASAADTQNSDVVGPHSLLSIPLLTRQVQKVCSRVLRRALLK